MLLWPAESCSGSQESAQIRPKLADVSQSLTGFDQRWTKLGKVRQALVDVGQSLANIWPSSATIGRKWPNFRPRERVRRSEGRCARLCWAM